MASIARGRSRRRESDGSSERNAARSTVTSPDYNGVLPSRKQATYPGILSDSMFAAVNRQSKSRKGSVVPMKMLIDEEFSNDVNARHISPGAVGRLMGLDSLPSSGTHNQHIYTRSHAPKTSPVGFHDRDGLHESIPHRRSAGDIIDVFDVMEATKTKMHRSPRSKNENTSSRSDKTDHADIDFIRQKFVDAKHLSTDESLHMSEEFNETLDALVSNRDVLLEFLQKFDPVVRRDPHNRDSPSSTANCITILKPSRRNQGTATESNFSVQKEVKHSLNKPYPNMSYQSLKEESGGPLRQKLSRSSHHKNAGKRGCPTRIVVLKPSLEKPHDVEGTLPLHHEISHSDYRKHKEYQDVGRWSPYAEDYMCQVPLGDYETLGRMGKGSREIAREITKQMRAARGGSRKHVVKSETITFADERSQFLSSVSKHKIPEAIHRSSEICDVWPSSSFNSSPTYSAETSVSKEAKRHLSNRWKKTHQCQDQVTDSDGFSTLGDVLALSDQEASKVSTHKMACRKCPKGEEVQSDRMQGSCIYPLGISSNDGWRDTAASKLTRSKSLPPSFIRGVQKSNNRKRAGSVRYNEFSMLKDVLKVGPHYSEYACPGMQRQSLGRDSTIHGDEYDLMSPDNEETMVVEREIHVNYEEPVNITAMPDTSEQSLHPANLDHELDAIGVLATSSAIPGSNRTPLSSTAQNQQMLKQTAATALDECLVDHNLDEIKFSIQDERIECHQADDYPTIYDPQIESDSLVGIDHCRGDSNQTLCIPPNGSESTTSSNKDDQQSPVSVLESSMDAEDVYSGDFEKISADLQELRMQLRLLKRETTDGGDDAELFILSDNETACQPLPEMEESHAFRDEEERDFSYVLDMLTGLGIHAANQDELLENCYLLECPAGTDLYDELENKYSSLILWTPAERKLLFDITSAVLRDITTSLMQSCSKGLLRMCLPGWDHEEFAEMVWQRVVQLRQEMVFNQENLLLSVEWASSEDGAYLVGSDIGCILQEDLLEEIIADFLGVAKSTKLCG